MNRKRKGERRSRGKKRGREKQFLPRMARMRIMKKTMTMTTPMFTGSLAAVTLKNPGAHSNPTCNKI